MLIQLVQAIALLCQVPSDLVLPGKEDKMIPAEVLQMACQHYYMDCLGTGLANLPETTVYEKLAVCIKARKG